MDNYKQNNGEQSNNKHGAVSSHSSSTLIISHYFWKETKKNKLDDGTFLITLQSWRLDQDH